jgi:uncharacterized membrane-anchored protein
MTDRARSSPPTVPRADRVALSNEWHARPGLSLPAPFRCSHVVELRHDGTIDDSRRSFAAFCDRFGAGLPAEDSRHHSVGIGSCLLKWEGHTEATSHTIFVPGNGKPPFSETALDFVDEDKRRQLLERMFIGVQIEVLEPPEEDPHGYETARSLLGSNLIYGGWMASRGAAVWSAFRLDSKGFVRLVIVDCGLSEARLSRLIQRMLDLETYRMLAMLALPKARQVMAALAELERELDGVMARLAEGSGEQQQEALLGEITRIAARVEHLSTAHAYRFAAARAYGGLVERRTAEVDEDVLGNHQRYTNFLMKTLAPAMRTCEAAERRTQEMAQRVERAANLLDTMVDMVQKKQNQEILQSMAERTKTQLRLQQAVEGFSIFAISYYAVGLLAYVLKSLNKFSSALDASVLTGIAAPLVFAVVWFSVRSVRRRLQGHGSDD